jgi:methylthioribose-1-phosphate isomerase
MHTLTYINHMVRLLSFTGKLEIVPRLARALSGTVIRGTPTLLITAGKHIQSKTVKTDSSGQNQSFVYQETRSRLTRARPRAEQWSRTNSRLARGSSQAVSAPSGQPKASLVVQANLAKSPYQPTVLHARLMLGSPDTLS